MTNEFTFFQMFKLTVKYHSNENRIPEYFWLMDGSAAIAFQFKAMLLLFFIKHFWELKLPKYLAYNKLQIFLYKPNVLKCLVESKNVSFVHLQSYCWQNQNLAPTTILMWNVYSTISQYKKNN